MSNEKIVRQNSLHTKDIRWEEHVEWFNKKIKGYNHFFFVAFSDSNEFIGQIRYAIENDVAEVSISITKEFRGKNLSVKLLKDTSDIIFKKRKMLKKIHAYIKVKNIPSTKTFERAGYIFKKKVKRLNTEQFLYVFFKKE